MNRVPIDQLQNKTRTGLQVKAFKPGDEHPQDQHRDIHRDDHYLFFILKQGSGSLEVDFKDRVIMAGQLFYVLPSQIHTRVKGEQAEGWFMAVDPALVPADLRTVFENRLQVQLPCCLSPNEFAQFENLLGVLFHAFTQRKRDQFYLPVIHALVRSFLGMAASNYDALDPATYPHSRFTDIARQFKKLLSIHFKAVKSPSAYAAMLNISPGYLNEAVKSVTGSTISYWIQQEMFNEAKRLLHQSDMPIKEIAHELGFKDHAYFVRAFRKSCGSSPLKFRLVSSR